MVRKRSLCLKKVWITCSIKLQSRYMIKNTTVCHPNYSLKDCSQRMVSSSEHWKNFWWKFLCCRLESIIRSCIVHLSPQYKLSKGNCVRSLWKSRSYFQPKSWLYLVSRACKRLDVFSGCSSLLCFPALQFVVLSLEPTVWNSPQMQSLWLLGLDGFNALNWSLIVVPCLNTVSVCLRNSLRNPEKLVVIIFVL